MKINTDHTPILNIDVSAAPNEVFSASHDLISIFQKQKDKSQTAKIKHHRHLNALWWPFGLHKKQALRYENPKANVPVYGERLFPAQKDGVEALVGVMAYPVSREVVLSLGGRLTELGEVKRGDAVLNFNVQEKPSGQVGDQVLILNQTQNAEKTKINLSEFEAALIQTLTEPDTVQVEKSPVTEKREQGVKASFVVPESVSWDGKAHRVRFEFTVKLPPEGRKNLETRFLHGLGLKNGRPAQHFQNQAAVVIALEEMFFAKPKTLKIVLDENTAQECEVKPDRFLGKKLALFLSQTAGGFFERQFFQKQSDDGLKLYQKNTSGKVVEPKVISESFTVFGASFRTTQVSYPDSPYVATYYEKCMPLENGKTANELSFITLTDPITKEEFLKISFFSKQGHGVRDLGVASREEQNGSFRFSVKGEEGFAYGDFTVSKTENLAPDAEGRPRYVTSLILKPKYSPDMRNKEITLGVLHTSQGIYTETQVDPLVIEEAPPHRLHKKRLLHHDKKPAQTIAQIFLQLTERL